MDVPLATGWILGVAPAPVRLSRRLPSGICNPGTGRYPNLSRRISACRFFSSVLWARVFLQAGSVLSALSPGWTGREGRSGVSARMPGAVCAWIAGAGTPWHAWSSPCAFRRRGSPSSHRSPTLRG